MNLYIDLDYVLWIYVVSATLVFLSGIYAIIVDYKNGFPIYGRDFFVLAVATLIPIVNTWVILALAYDFFVQFLSFIVLKRK